MKRFIPLLALGALTANVANAELQRVTYTQPEGEVRTYHGFSHTAYLDPAFGITVNEDHDGLARNVIFADNGDVWFKDPITWVQKGGWIKGHMDENNLITIDFPIIFPKDENDQSESFQIDRLVKGVVNKPDGTQQTTWIPDQSKSIIQFKYIEEEDRIVQVNEGMAAMIGLVADGAYQYYGDYGVEYTRVKETAHQFPNNVEPEKWTFKCNYAGDYAILVDVAITGNEFYLKGFWPDYPDSTIKGIVEDDKVTFPSQQYMGFMTSNVGMNYYIYTVTGHKEPFQYTFRYVCDNIPLEFKYDKEARTLTPLFSEETNLMVSKGKTTGTVSDGNNTYVSYTEMSLKANTEIKELRVPEVKEITQYLDTGWGSLMVDLVPYDADVNALDTSRFYYRLYRDNGMLPLDPADSALNPKAYEGIDEPMEEIPYTFINGEGLTSMGSSKNRTVYYFRPADERMGVQSLYKLENGETIYSDVCFIDVNNFETYVVKWEDMPNNPNYSSVESISDAPVVSVKCYDINGRAVSADYKGLIIEEKTLSDGKRIVSKRMSR
ncbi:MAG: hypothetical protein K2N19_06920 [Muribaculaceae bacterium]|nr:hypothetical protein [Muribaculaceae bacterium]